MTQNVTEAWNSIHVNLNGDVWTSRLLGIMHTADH
jgi:hypothetical protein